MERIISVPKGQNIGRAIIASFVNYSKVEVTGINVIRNASTRAATVVLKFTWC